MSNPFNQTFQNGNKVMLDLLEKYGIKLDSNIWAYSMDLIAATNTAPERDEELHTKLDRIIDKINDMAINEGLTVEEAMEISQVKPCRTSRVAVTKLLQENKMLIYKPGQKATYVKQITHEVDSVN